ncbi:sulfate reduction electron transfer complex DsrMKJOP subunit DsrJ [Desulfohalobium retbaense]|uniref:Membrane-bound menaquinol oxidoreductase, cytochrome c subunit n=1 Tax=Desulfohalobium retbaense (strain ATCC 49708 / DSM 5692 / JCM 16813 / HR100) TaxID=485915 RepID=C8WZR4_DESRD|nr:sulfate reduction electron transfer complex DsrMKJOP subunit DsrJ [Desulfohalobium retbaense]ACV67539.1 membrane-bound menaquinol oxidoreductase, cytochrome c subunit [Desulfohalobium retbaense DSM 5692]
MYDGGKVITGLIIFVGLMTFPFWFNLGNAAYERPELQEVKDAEECIEPTEYMRTEHMQLLNDWRDSVVREKNRIYVSTTGKEVTMSLQNTCMDCHTSKQEFCDKCHNSAAVSPYCWDCHIAPEEEQQGTESAPKEESHG